MNRVLALPLSIIASALCACSAIEQGEDSSPEVGLVSLSPDTLEWVEIGETEGVEVLQNGLKPSAIFARPGNVRTVLVFVEDVTAGEGDGESEFPFDPFAEVPNHGVKQLVVEIGSEGKVQYWRYLGSDGIASAGVR